MKKLIEGILDFRKHRLREYREKFSKLALGQSPDTLFIACSDSRVVPNLFASTDPGDLFVIRNVGNFVPPCKEDGSLEGAEWAGIEFSLLELKVSDIIVCGHSECGAIGAVMKGTVSGDHLKAWLDYGKDAAQMASRLHFADGLSPHNRISQANVLLQMEHLKTYSVIREKISLGKLNLHGWWFDIASGDVHAYNQAASRFELIGER